MEDDEVLAAAQVKPTPEFWRFRWRFAAFSRMRKTWINQDQLPNQNCFAN